MKQKKKIQNLKIINLKIEIHIKIQENHIKNQPTLLQMKHHLFPKFLQKKKTKIIHIIKIKIIVAKNRNIKKDIVKTNHDLHQLHQVQKVIRDLFIIIEEKNIIMKEILTTKKKYQF